MYVQINFQNVGRVQWYDISDDVKRWSEKYQISYKLKWINIRRGRIVLPTAEDYTMFALTWDEFTSSKFNWEFIEPMKSPNQLT